MTEVIHLRRGLSANPALCGADVDPDPKAPIWAICPRCSELLPMQELSELSL